MWLFTEIPKPEIKTLMGINGSLALIQWKHPPKEAGEIKYTVSWGENTSMEVQESEDSFVLINGFEPEESYNVTVKIHVDFDEHSLSNVSDPGVLTMPAAGDFIMLFRKLLHYLHTSLPLRLTPDFLRCTSRTLSSLPCRRSDPESRGDQHQ